MHVARNDPCPCGSGRKYKKCCGATANSALAPRPNTLHSTGIPALMASATQYSQIGKLDLAEGIFNEVLEMFPAHAEALHSLGVIGLRTGRYTMGEELISKAIQIKPMESRYYNSFGSVAHALGELHNAIERFKHAVMLDPTFYEAHFNLGNAFKDQGNFIEAIKHYKAAIDLKPNTAEVHANLGAASLQAGHFSEAFEHHSKALALRPEWSWVRSNLELTMRRLVPTWHFTMMNDKRRNLAFQMALRKAIGEKSVVLDIGTGSGLLAMMAAQAGAKRVIACEAVPLIANKAEQIIQKNGYGERITLIKKKSTDIKLGTDMPERANVIVAEIVDAGLLGEGILPTLEHAKRELADKEAVIIPKRAIVHATLIESADLVSENTILNGNSCGFDLKLFNEFSTSGYKQVALQHYSYRELSIPLRIFDFDFTRDIAKHQRRQITFFATAQGTVHAIAFWFHLLLDDEIFLDTGPRGKCSHWMQAVQVFGDGLSVEEAQTVQVVAEHDLATISFRVLKSPENGYLPRDQEHPDRECAGPL